MKIFRLAILLLVTIVSFSVSGNEEDIEQVDECCIIEKVRIFSGFALSNDRGLKTPSVIVLIQSNKRIEAKFLALQGIALEFKDTIEIPEKGERILFSSTLHILDSGVIDDPRGFKVKWEAELLSNKIVGTYEQPFDSGKFILHEAYVK